VTIRDCIGARRRALRLAGTLIATVGLLPAQAPGTPTAPTGDPTGTATTAGRVPGGHPFDPEPLSGRCGDPAGVWLNTDWPAGVRWQLNSGSIPGYLLEPQPAAPADTRPGPAAVLTAAQSAAHAVATGRNDCGLPEDRTIRERYTGDTARNANITVAGSCGTGDGHNVVSFGPLDGGRLAVTCLWWDGRPGQSRTVEVDIRVDSTSGAFFLSQPEECQARWDLEGILTHEFGHVFGLGHVSSAGHSTLTMSDGLPECTTAFRGLGLGDYLALHGQQPSA
jgi:hypothetical protein